MKRPAIPTAYAALEAISARLSGSFDNPALTSYGPLSVHATEDCLRFADEALAAFRSKISPGFNPARDFQTVIEAVEYCLSFPSPIFALEMIVSHNIHLDEMGFASDLIRAFPDGPLPERSGKTATDAYSTLQAAASLMQDLNADYEHPGYISITRYGLTFAFGVDVRNGKDAFVYNFGPAIDPGAIQEGGFSTLKAEGVSVHELAIWIRREVTTHMPADQATDYPTLHRPIGNEEEARAFFTYLHNNGMLFHLDDHPLDCLDGRIYPADALAIIHRIHEAGTFTGFDPYEFVCTLSNPSVPPVEFDSQTYLRCLGCGEFVNESEADAHSH